MRLAIDLGGTNIRIAQVENGECLNRTSIPCLAHQNASVVLKQLSQLIASVMNKRVEGIGIGVPSIVDSENGIVYDVANISSWKEVHLKTLLESEFGVPVAINNDSNCFALGENLFGVGKPYANIVGVTIGTGIGAGVIVDHRLYCGQYTGAGEIGCLPYLDSNFENYCSSFFFKQNYQTTGAIAAEKARQGDKKALKMWAEFGIHLGHLMKAILYAYAPQAVVLGGGIAGSFSLFKQSMKEIMQEYPYAVILSDLDILVSEMQDVSLLGASALLDE